MLRISVTPSDSAVTVKLEGKVVGPWVEECHRTWHVLRPTLGSRKLYLDLCGVTFVDARGTKLLQKIYQLANAEVLADSPLTSYFAERIVREIHRNEREGA